MSDMQERVRFYYDQGNDPNVRPHGEDLDRLGGELVARGYSPVFGVVEHAPTGSLAEIVYRPPLKPEDRVVLSGLRIVSQRHEEIAV